MKRDTRANEAALWEHCSALWEHRQALCEHTCAALCEQHVVHTCTCPQGYHDVASVFLMTLSSPSLTSSVLSAVSSSHLRDAMSSDFTSLILALRLLIFPMVHLFDPALHSFLRSSGVEPFFALSWVITWFSHDIRNIDTASRLADAFIASHPLLPMYVSVALMIHPECRKFILSTECDFPMVHSVLCSLPGKVMETETRGESRAKRVQGKREQSEARVSKNVRLTPRCSNANLLHSFRSRG